MRVAARVAISAALVLLASAAGAAPRNYVFTGKFTSNRGTLVNIPVIGDTPCAGVGLSNLRIMSGPGLTGPHTLFSMTAMTMQPNPTPAVHPFNQFANGDKADYYCAGFAPGKKVTTTGIGVGGQFTVPTLALNHPLPGGANAVRVPNATPIIQLATSFAITGPRKLSTLITPSSPSAPYLPYPMPPDWRKFQKDAHKVQPRRVQGAMFTYCWGNPGCTNVTQGTQPLIVKYTGGGNNFGGTMSYVISSGPQRSSLAVAGLGGPVNFAILAGTASQPTGRAYGARLTDPLSSGPLWGMYMIGTNGLITMVTYYLGAVPGGNNYNRGFPFTTMTVLARNTGTVAGNKRATTLTAKGGDTVTPMGKRNISLVAGGMARTVVGPAISNTPEIAQMYIPEPSRSAQLLAGALGLLAIAAVRRRRR